MAIDLTQISESVVKGRIDQVKEMVEQALSEGTSPENVMNEGLVAGMETVGEKWKADEMFMPEVIRSAKAMSGAMDIVRPKLSDTDAASSACMVIGTVKGDLHDIGKDLAAMMFEGAGYKVVNVGIDQPAEAFVDAVKEHKPQVLGLSALLTTTMPRMGEVINSLKEAGIRDQLAVIVGGAPVTEEYAQECGADLYAANARNGVEKVREYFSSKN